MNFLRVGQITRPHGVNGAVKVMPLTNDPKRFRVLKEAFLERDGAYTPVSISDAKLSADFVYLTLECSKSAEEAERLRGQFICVDRAHAVKLPEGQYFIVDLIGLSVLDTNGNALGTLTDVFETGANDVYEITHSNGKKLLIPALKRLLHNVDIENKRMELDSLVLAEVGLFED